MSTRFDLEQQILECWHVTGDIKLVMERACDHGMTQDELANVLIGLEALYELKFNRLWETFEQCVKTKQI